MKEIFHPSSKFTKSYYSSCKLKLGETGGSGGGGSGSTISCAGATSDLRLNVKLYRSESGGGFHVYNAVNNELIAVTFGYYLNEGTDFSSQLEINPDYADKIEFLDLWPTVYDSDFVANAYIRIRNISSEDIRIRVEVRDYGTTLHERTTLDILSSYQNTPAIEWNENDATNAKYSLNACLAGRKPCVAKVKTLTLKKPTVDLTQHSLVIKYLIESSGFTGTLTDTLVYSGNYRDPTSTTYDVDYAKTVCGNIQSKFKQYSNITFENSQPENVISPVNNCIDNRGDVQFELRLNGLNTSINTIDLIMTEDRGATLIKVSTPANADKNAALNSLASQLVAHGYTSVAPANNERITLKKSDVRSLYVITGGYTSHSFSVNGADWSYDGNLNVEGVYRDNVAVRPMSCTLGLKDPYRNFENYTLTFKGYPLIGPFPINYTKVTILPVDSEDLEENQLDFLTTLTDLDSFSFETCYVIISGPG